MREKEMPGYMTYRETAIMLSFLPDEEAGMAIKAAVSYFLDGVEPEGLPANAKRVYDSAKKNIDQSRVAYVKKCEGAKRGNEEKKRKKELGLKVVNGSAGDAWKYVD